MRSPQQRAAELTELIQTKGFTTEYLPHLDAKIAEAMESLTNHIPEHETTKLRASIAAWREMKTAFNSQLTILRKSFT
jgi:hypothetical protein